GHREVSLGDGEVIRARAVVIATDGRSAARLTGGEVADPGSRGFVTLYYAASQSPSAEPILLLNGEGQGPVNHVAVLSHVSPACAPSGQALIAAGVIGAPAEDDARLDREARIQLDEWFGSKVAGWRLLRVYRVPHAMSDQTAG